MKLQQLRYLLAIVDSGLNITAAAGRLYTSQPGVSKQIKLLEEELGVQLFSRKGKSLDRITPAGQEILERASTIMREVQNIAGVAQNHQKEQRGRLSIGTTHTQARYVLPSVIHEFRSRYPNVVLELHQGTSEQIAEMVTGRKIDFAIATDSQHLFDELFLLPCYRWDRSVIVPANHPLANNAQRPTLTQLAAYPLLTYVFSSDGTSSLKQAFEEQDLTPNVVFTARDADVIKTYVRMGLGVGIVASMAEDCEEGGGLVAFDGKGLFPRCTTWIGFQRDTVLRNYIHDFVELFAPHLTTDLTRTAAKASDQEAVDALLEGITLPLRGGISKLSAGAPIAHSRRLRESFQAVDYPG